jgi:hypothetical protein
MCHNDMYANPRATIAIVPANLRKLKHVARVSTARRKISQSSEKLSASPHLSSRLAYRKNVNYAYHTLRLFTTAITFALL